MSLPKNTRVAIASDHAGFSLKSHLSAWLKEQNVEVMDLGPDDATRVDYPDFADKVAAVVNDGQVEWGVLVCGSGIGMCMRANRFSQVRAVNCTQVLQAKLSRAHNNANLICLGERLLGTGLAEEILSTFLTTHFDGGRHEGRVAKMSVEVTK